MSRRSLVAALVPGRWRSLSSPAPPRPPAPPSASSPAPKASSVTRHRGRRRRRQPGRLPPLRAHHRGQLQSRPANRPASPASPSPTATSATSSSTCRRGCSKTRPRCRACSRPSSTPPRVSPFEAEPLRRELSRRDPDRRGHGALLLRRRRHPHLRRLQPGAAAGRALGARLHPLRGADRLHPPRAAKPTANTGSPCRPQASPQQLDLSGFTLTIWGAPWDVTHDPERGNCLNEAEPALGWAKCSVGPPSQNPALAYLTLPTSCAGPLTFAATASSWQQPGTVSSRLVTHYNQGEPSRLEGCEALAFEPAPHAGSSPTPAPPRRAASTSASTSTAKACCDRNRLSRVAGEDRRW